MKKLRKLLLATLVLMLSISMYATVFAAGSIKMSEKSIVVLQGRTYTLSVKGSNKGIRWQSSNEKVASVSKTGKVKAIEAGSATVSATVNGKTVTCKVVVPKTYTFKYKGHTYSIVNRGMKWNSAYKCCKNMGGHLATITSKGEQKAINKNIKKLGSEKKNNYWLGGKKDKSGNVYWITKEKMKYTNWASAQPDNPAEDALMLYTFNNPYTFGDDSYKWNDLVNKGTCGSESWFGLDDFGFICEWDK